MVGLIPQDHVLHVIGDSGEPGIYERKELLRQCEEENVKIVSSTESSHLKAIIRQYRPEILLIEEEVFKANIATQQEHIYRSKSCQPFKLVYTKSDISKEEIFEYLKQGADEVITKDSSDEEIFLKFYTILRRKSVLELNSLTDLPAINRTYTVLEHCRNNLSDWAAIHCDILHFQSYSLMYGVDQSDSAISETAKIVQKALVDSKVDEYFIGHLGRDNFLILSDSNSIEDINYCLRESFIDVLNKLYKQADIDNGYIICSAPNKVRRREGLLDLNIGHCTNIDRNFLSGTDIIEQAVKNKNNSETKNKRVLILEDDEDFASLLEETLIREGNEARRSQGFESLIEEVEDYRPRVLILEAAKLGHQNFIPLCDSLARYKDEFGLKILVATNVPGYQNFLATGADVYLPKPYDLEVLLKEVRRLRFATA